MTLIMGMAYKDQFVIMSSDTKVTLQKHDALTFERAELLPVEIGENEGKIHRLSNSTLIATSGIQKTGNIVEDEMMKRVKPEYSLEQCAGVLQEVITMLCEKRKTYVEVGTEDMDALSLNFIGNENFGCVLFGFLSNGTSGHAYLDHTDLIVKIIESPMSEGFGCCIISPDPGDQNKYGNWLLIRKEEERSLSNYIQQFKFIHGKLSLTHKTSVSSDCNLHVLVKDSEGNYQHATNVIETNILHSIFTEHPEIDYKTFYKLYN
ncbi:Ntn hydrolase family protein [Bacillus pacificus]|uniref:hypothetical protein n=1 Tax=Bacillus pacificus TaxID=2026187 RepID=UPI00397D6131